MRFDPPLVEARLLRRYKRFLADVALADGTEATVHAPNPGAMLGVCAPGARVWLQPSAPRAKLPFAWRLIEADGGLVGIDTQLPNRLVDEALTQDRIPVLAGYAQRRREVPYAEASRIDFLLEDPARPPCYLEVKNVHMRRAGALAEFPDCKAARSARHMADLAAERAHGARAVVLFVIQRTDCTAFSPAADIDPAFAASLAQAAAAGVELMAHACEITPSEVRLTHAVPVAF